MSKNFGKLFEQNFQKSCIKQNICCIRLVDSNKFDFGQQSRFTPTNICDFICFDGDILCLTELKHTIGTSISFNQPPTEKGGQPMIKPHQVKSLLERSKYPNVYCGLLLDFADRINKKGEVIEGGTYFVEINVFVGWASSVTKKSINKDDCEIIGVKVDRTKKKVNYSYDIKKLLEDIKG